MKARPFANLMVIDEEKSDSAYGVSPAERSINQLMDSGFIPLDKPPGPTSHEVVAWTRRILSLRKAGHSGTLDPLATGLLPIGLGEATKALGALLLGPKEYYAVMRLHDPVDDARLRAVLHEFTAEIYQRPPQRSSVKRMTRVRRVYELELLETHGKLLLVRVLCEAGTYIRKLVYDIGEVLGIGATMAELRRTKVANLGENDGFVTLHELYDAIHEFKENGREGGLRRAVRPIEEALSHLGLVVIRDSTVDAICHGAQLAVPGILSLSTEIKKGDVVGIYTRKGELVGTAEALMNSSEIQEIQRGIAFRTTRVIMQPGKYPSLWGRKVTKSLIEDEKPS